MTRLHEWMVEATLGAVAVIAGVAFLHSSVRGESDTCNSGVCLNILYYDRCNALPAVSGIALQFQDCIPCWANGRCASLSNSSTCKTTENPQGIATATVYDTCDCDILNPDQVEAWSSYIGPFDQDTSNQYTCQGGS